MNDVKICKQCSNSLPIESTQCPFCGSAIPIFKKGKYIALSAILLIGVFFFSVFLAAIFGYNYYYDYEDYFISTFFISFIQISFIVFPSMYFFYIKKTTHKLFINTKRYVLYSLSCVAGICLFISTIHSISESDFTASIFVFWFIILGFIWLFFILPIAAYLGKRKERRIIKEFLNKFQSNLSIDLERISQESCLKVSSIKRHIKYLLKKRLINGNLVENQFIYGSVPQYHYSPALYTQPPSRVPSYTESNGYVGEIEYAEKRAYIDENLQYIVPPEPKANQSTEHEILDSTILIHMPTHIERGTTSEVIVDLKNKTGKNIENIKIDLSLLKKYFSVEDEFEIDALLPGMEIKNSIKIRPKYHEGTFPIKIVIWGNGVSIEKEYTIKVGGTEVY